MASHFQRGVLQIDEAEADKDSEENAEGEDATALDDDASDMQARAYRYIVEDPKFLNKIKLTVTANVIEPSKEHLYAKTHPNVAKAVSCLWSEFDTIMKNASDDWTKESFMQAILMTASKAVWEAVDSKMLDFVRCVYIACTEKQSAGDDMFKGLNKNLITVKTFLPTKLAMENLLSLRSVYMRLVLCEAVGALDHQSTLFSAKREVLMGAKKM
eukprot:1637088-Karenia_brevis.AAC.1